MKGKVKGTICGAPIAEVVVLFHSFLTRIYSIKPVVTQYTNANTNRTPYQLSTNK